MEKFKHCEELYFPHNSDFRDRTYPIPPHLSNIGSDLLKVQFANLAGKEKYPLKIVQLIHQSICCDLCDTLYCKKSTLL